MLQKTPKTPKADKRSKPTEEQEQQQEPVAGEAAKPAGEKRAIIIKKPSFEIAKIKMISTAPYIQNRFSSDNRKKMEEKQREGSSKAKTRKAKPAKDFEKVYRGSMHVSEEGWCGIPCSGIRNAMIDACRLTEFDMVRAKMCIRVIEDGYDRENFEGLTRIYGTPEMHIDRVKVGMNQTDLASRAMFKKWHAIVTIQWDAEVFQAVDVYNLLARAGWQVGIGAGRPLSKMSGGTGKGTFDVEPV